MKIGIASGKGGTGKTSVSVNLFHRLQKTQDVCLVDCDVEEPNAQLFLNKELLDSEAIHQLVPQIDTSVCTYCNSCVEFCEFNAINLIQDIGMAEINENMCHSCGACIYACSHEAISEQKKEIGQVHFYSTFVEGKLRIGSTMQTPLIKDLKKEVPMHKLVLYDAPPGTSCPVVETIHDNDFVILVAEPTLFGFHDFKLMYELIQSMNIPFGVIINKSEKSNSELHQFIRNNSILLLGEIPFDEDFAKQYAKAKILEQQNSNIEIAYSQIIENLKSCMKLL